MDCRKPGEKAQDAAVQTRLPLPRAVFADTVLRVSAECPQHAIAGEAFPLLLRMRNPTPLLQQLTLAVGDASGFVIAGERPVRKLPGNCKAHKWQACFHLGRYSGYIV